MALLEPWDGHGVLRLRERASESVPATAWQRISDMSITGNDSDIATMLRNAKSNPDVRERRRQLRAEK